MADKFSLNDDQRKAFTLIEQFIEDPEQDVFILCGPAGSGKTTSLARVIDSVLRRGMVPLLLAPTGKAVGILRDKIEQLLSLDRGQLKASTIHRAIFYLSGLTIEDPSDLDASPAVTMDFSLKRGENRVDLVIVDEASMIGNDSRVDRGVRFGSNRLLNDLMRHLGLDKPEEERTGQVKVLFVGDLAQLLPVNCPESPALLPDYFYNRYGIKVQRYELTTVVRQADGSDVLKLAQEARQRIVDPSIGPIKWSFGKKIDFTTFYQASADIAGALKRGQSIMAVVRTNEQASRYNAAVRRCLWGGHRINIVQGETLLVTKNSPQQDLANGDLVRVVEVSLNSRREDVKMQNGRVVRLGFKQLKIQITRADGTSSIRDVLVLENLLHSNNRELSEAQRWALVEHVRQRHRHIDQDSDAFKELLETDIFYNAVQVKFGYALTCHKAQGGEWPHVIVDSGDRPLESQEDWRWFYTAVTRSKDRLTLVNFADFQ